MFIGKRIGWKLMRFVMHMEVQSIKEDTIMTKTFEFYWNDLTEDAQKRLFDFLGGENGNYDYFPFATLEVEVDEDEEDE